MDFTQLPHEVQELIIDRIGLGSFRHMAPSHEMEGMVPLFTKFDDHKVDDGDVTWVSRDQWGISLVLETGCTTCMSTYIYSDDGDHGYGPNFIRRSATLK